MKLGSRFWSKVDKSGECWVWTAATNGKGYGRFAVGKTLHYPHRLSYEAHHGPVPDGLVVDHLCSNRACVRPSHLEAVTPRENVRRGNGHGSETHCPRGHPYDETNTYVDRLGRRYCKTCQREGKRRRAREAREAEFPLVPVEIEGAA